MTDYETPEPGKFHFEHAAEYLGVAIPVVLLLLVDFPTAKSRPQHSR